jgi:hypothetical protein
VSGRVHTVRIDCESYDGGERFYNVTIDPCTLLAIDQESALLLAKGIAVLIERHTINTAEIVSGGET